MKWGLEHARQGPLLTKKTCVAIKKVRKVKRMFRAIPLMFPHLKLRAEASR
jgi:hypothetical protein